MTDSNDILNDRSREILRLIVDSYLENPEPLGSRTLSRKMGLNLSPATIRNVMSDLQEAGLLYSPHTSAGRLPTDKGLRLFVDGLLERGRLSADERAQIETQCKAAGIGVNQILEEATRMLSGLSNCAGLVSAPVTDAPLKHIEFVALGAGRALVVMVTADGSVENRVIDMPLGLPASSLVEATNFLSDRLVGLTLEEARSKVQAELDAHRHELNEVTARLVEAGVATWTDGGGGSPALIVSGADKLLDEINAVEDLEHVRRLFAALETREGLVRLIDATKTAQGVQIFIGAENELFGLTGCAMIIAPYANSQQEIVGAIGVIGPTRVDYGRIIPVVDYTSKVIGKLLH
ncbi:MAG: heat-inducible transcriptional repressor HrcA [Alphaproteobacteria bacterium]|nr:heat-inducible transcriptional repressor HrcA [Alphaproteobacteria bacterium]MCZ6763500.1 heat-inducible transcriptional repressor HrcA [Alphaproteobacteria bacterium]